MVLSHQICSSLVQQPRETKSSPAQITWPSWETAALDAMTFGSRFNGKRTFSRQPQALLVTRTGERGCGASNFPGPAHTSGNVFLTTSSNSVPGQQNRKCKGSKAEACLTWCPRVLLSSLLEQLSHKTPEKYHRPAEQPVVYLCLMPSRYTPWQCTRKIGGHFKMNEGLLMHGSPRYKSMS